MQVHRAIKLQNEELAKQNEYMLQQVQILNLTLTEEEEQQNSLDQRFPNYGSRPTCGSQKESWWVVKSYRNLEISYNF